VVIRSIELYSLYVIYIHFVSYPIAFISKATLLDPSQPPVGTEHAVLLLGGFGGLVAAFAGIHILLHGITTNEYESRWNIALSGTQVKVGKA